jgi:hypothetical protein
MSKGRGRQGEAKGYLPSLLPESVLLDPSRPEVARLIVVMVQHGTRSLIAHGCTARADQRGMRADVFADPRAPRRELSTDMAVKGKYAVPAQSWSLRGSGDCPSCMSCRPSLKTCSI